MAVSTVGVDQMAFHCFVEIVVGKITDKEDLKSTFNLVNLINLNYAFKEGTLDD